MKRRPPLSLELKRVIVFTKDVPALARWYEATLGLPILELAEDGGWAELDAGECRLALHGGGCKRTNDCGHKFTFGAKHVAKTRETLVARGAKLGPVKVFGPLHYCDGRDPEGNVFQISNRV